MGKAKKVAADISPTALGRSALVNITVTTDKP